MGRQIASSERPQIVILGSSRAAFGIVPKLLAESLGLPEDAVVNAAFPGMYPNAIEEGWSIFEEHLKKARLVVYVTDDYYLHRPVKPTPIGKRNSIEGLTPFRKLGNVWGNVRNALFYPDQNLYYFDTNGFLHHPHLEAGDRMTDPKKREEVVDGVVQAWFSGMMPDDEAPKRLVQFGEKIQAGGARLVFVHLPVHSSHRKRTLEAYPSDFAWYLAEMNAVAQQLGTRFYYLDRPEDLGLDDQAFVADTIHMRPEKAAVATRELARLTGLLELPKPER